MTGFLPRLPQIHEEIEKSLMITRGALLELPKKPSDDPRSEISTLLHEFTSNVARHIEGVPIGSVVPFSGGGDGKGLIQSINAAQENFRISIRVTAPNFRPFEKKDADTKYLHSAPKFLKHEEGDELVDDINEEVANYATGSKRQRTSDTESRIYIDEVLEVARKYEHLFPIFLCIFQYIFAPFQNTVRALESCQVIIPLSYRRCSSRP